MRECERNRRIIKHSFSDRFFSQTSQTLHKHLGNTTKISSLIHSCKLKQTQIRPPLRLCVCSTVIEKTVSVCIYECTRVWKWGREEKLCLLLNQHTKLTHQRTPQIRTHTLTAQLLAYTRPSLISHSKHNMFPPDQSIQLWQLACFSLFRLAEWSTGFLRPVSWENLNICSPTGRISRLIIIKVNSASMEKNTGRLHAIRAPRRDWARIRWPH